MIFRASLLFDSGKNWHPSDVKIPTCSSPDSPPVHTWCTDSKLWCIPSMCIALMPSPLKVGSLIKPSDVAFITAPNAGVIGILHLIVSFKLMVLVVQDIRYHVRQSNFQLTCYKYHGNSVRQGWDVLYWIVIILYRCCNNLQPTTRNRWTPKTASCASVHIVKYKRLDSWTPVQDLYVCTLHFTY